MGGSVAESRVDICSNCHPFYTGEQRIVDTEGRVDKFMNRLRARERYSEEQAAKEAAKQNADFPIEDLELGTRYTKILREAGIEQISDLLRRLNEEGDDGILALPGIGVKVLADAKRRISERGYQLSSVE